MKTGTVEKGVALAAIIFASIFGALAPTSARDSAGAIERGNIVYCGERGLNVSAIISSGGAFYGMADTTADGGLIVVADNTDFNVPITTKIGPYNVTSREGTVADIIVDEPIIAANVFLEGTTDSVVGMSIPMGTRLQVRINPNFGGLMKNAADRNWGKVKIKLIDPDGFYRTKKIDANDSEITVGPTADINDVVWDHLDTAWWDTGVWKVRITTDKATCNDVDVSSPEYEFTVRSSELSIDAVEEVVYKGWDIILTVTGFPNYYYYFAIENVTGGDEPYIKDTADIVSLGTGEGSPGAATAAWIKTGSDGIADIKIDTCRVAFAERIYTMHVYDTYHVTGAVPNETDGFAAPADVAGAKDEDEEKVKLEPVKVTFDIPEIVVIGDEVMIKGTVSGGNKVDILIEDGDTAYFNDEPMDENKEFEVEWDTVGLTTGTYKIDVYIDCLFDSFEEIEAAGIETDGGTTIRLISYPYLDASLSKNTVLVGDSFELSGNTSFGYVEIVTISPKGGSGTGMEGLYGVSIYTVPTFMAIDTFSDSEIAIKEKGDGVGVNALTTGKIVFDMPSTCIIGENVAVKGSASEGDSVDIAMDDIVKAVDIPIENGTFYTVISTAGYLPGSYTIEGFIDGDYSVGEDVSGEENDGAIAIRLISAGLTTNLSSDTVQPGGKFVITGTATGTDHVDIITISPKGGGGAGLYEESYPGVPGITNESIPVENNSFSKTINVSGYATVSSMISGDGGGGGGGRAPPPDSDYTYKIWVSVPGRDGYYGDGYGDNASDILNHIIDYYCTGDVSKLRSKTQDQILDMLKDATINMAGSDDLAGVMDLTVRHPTYNFYKRIKVDSDADTGNYTILVLSPGIDGVYGDSYYSYIDSILDLDGAGPELGAIDVSNMTQEEIISIIEDVTINQAGSDDLIWIGNIVVTQFDIFDTGSGI